MRKYVFGVALAIACTIPASAEEVCKLKRYAVIPFEADETAHIYVPATIAGRSTRLMLDTGAYWSLIREDLAKSLNLKIKRSTDMHLIDLAGKKIDQIATVPVVKIGPVAFSGEVDFFIGGDTPGHTIDQEGGIFGLNLLTQMDLEIDNAGKTISLFSQDHCQGDGVHWATEAVTLKYKRQQADRPIGTRLKQKIDKNQIDSPIVVADLEGEPLSVLFDTGATYSALDLGVAKARFGIGPGSPGVEFTGKTYTGSGEALDTYKYTFKSLTIAGIHFENIPIRLVQFDNSSQMLIGMNEMKHLRLYFSFKEGLIHITAADAGRSQ